MGRKFVWTLVGFALVLVGALVVASANIDGYLNANRTWLTQQVQATLGRRIEFTRVGVTWFGGLAVRIHDVTLSEDPAFGPTPFFDARGIEVHLRFLPALFGRMEVSQVLLDRPRLSIIKTAGSLNLASLGQTRAVEEAEEEALSADEIDSGAAPLVIALINVHEGTVVYEDVGASDRSRRMIEHVNVAVSDFNMAEPLNVRLSAELARGEGVALTAEGIIGPVDLSSPAQTLFDIEVALEVDDAESLIAAARSFGIDASSASLSGPVQAAVTLSGDPSLVRVSGRIDGRRVAAAYGERFTKPEGTDLTATVTSEYADRTLRVDDLTIELGAARLHAAGTLAMDEAGSYDFQVVSEPAAMPVYEELFPGVRGSGIVGGTVSVDVTIQGGAQRESVLRGTVKTDAVGIERAPLPRLDGISTVIEFTDNTVTLPPTPVTVAGAARVMLSGTIDDLTRPVAALTLRGESVPLAAFLGGKGASDEPAQADGGHDRIEQLVIHATVRPDGDTATVEAAIASPNGRVRDFDYQDLSVRIVQSGRITDIPLLRLSVFDGELGGSGKVVVDGRGDPHFELALDAQSIRYAQASQWLAPGSSRALDGFVDAELRLAGAGHTWPSVRETLEGSGSLRMRDGRLVNMNVAEDLLRGMTGIPRLSSLLSTELERRHPWLFGHTGTDFESLSATFTIADGALSTSDLTIMTGEYGMAAAGRIGLDGQVELEAFFEASDRLTADLIAEVGSLRYLNNEYGRIVVPFEVVGAIPDTHAKADMAYVSGAVGRAVVGGIARGVSGIAAGLGRIAEGLSK